MTRPIANSSATVLNNLNAKSISPLSLINAGLMFISFVYKWMFSFHPVDNVSIKLAQAYLRNELASILLRPLQLITNETIRNNFLN